MEYNKDSENLQEHGMEQKNMPEKTPFKEKKKNLSKMIGQSSGWLQFWWFESLDREQELEIDMSRGAPR